MGEWRDIQTAPKDGSQMLWYGKWKPYEHLKGGGEHCIRVVSWSTFQSNGTGHQWIAAELSPVQSYNVDFTHWMPLPAPPADKQRLRAGEARRRLAMGYKITIMQRRILEAVAKLGRTNASVVMRELGINEHQGGFYNCWYSLFRREFLTCDKNVAWLTDLGADSISAT